MTSSRMTMITEPTDERWERASLSNLSPLLECTFRFDRSLNNWDSEQREQKHQRRAGRELRHVRRRYCYGQVESGRTT